jgi:hypothetical protein
MGPRGLVISSVIVNSFLQHNSLVGSAHLAKANRGFWLQHVGRVHSMHAQSLAGVHYSGYYMLPLVGTSTLE